MFLSVWVLNIFQCYNLQEDEVDLVTILKGAAFYRRGRFHDYVNDYLPPTESEFNKVCESLR